MLAIPLVEAVGKERTPRCSAFRDHDAETRVPFENTGCNQCGRRPLSAECRLEVVEHGSPGAPVVQTVRGRGIMRLGADVKRQDHAGVFERGPDWIPVVALISGRTGWRRDRKEGGFEAEVRRPVDLLDGR